MAIFGKQVFKQIFEGTEKKTEILEISNRHKNTFEDLIHSLDIELVYMPKQVNKGPCNIIPSFEDFSTEFKLDNNFLVK